MPGHSADHCAPRADTSVWTTHEANALAQSLSQITANKHAERCAHSTENRIACVVFIYCASHSLRSWFDSRPPNVCACVFVNMLLFTCLSKERLATNGAFCYHYSLEGSRLSSFCCVSLRCGTYRNNNNNLSQ